MEERVETPLVIHFREGSLFAENSKKLIGRRVPYTSKGTRPEEGQDQRISGIICELSASTGEAAYVGEMCCARPWCRGGYAQCGFQVHFIQGEAVKVQDIRNVVKEFLGGHTKGNPRHHYMGCDSVNGRTEPGERRDGGARGEVDDRGWR
jgi:hypothetical protein